MGTVFSFDIRPPYPAPAILDAAISAIRAADQRFSPFIPGSELNRFNQGKLLPEQLSPDFHTILSLCQQLYFKTEQAFNPWPNPAPFDPSGLVKGWAAERPAAILRAAGSPNFCLNAGGDILASGLAAAKPWQVGLQHPSKPEMVSAVLSLSDLACATSGLYQRGPHLWNQRGQPLVSDLQSVTVVGPSLARADAYATAFFVTGTAGLSQLRLESTYAAYLVTSQDQVLYSSALAALISPPPPLSVPIPGPTHMNTGLPLSTPNYPKPKL